MRFRGSLLHAFKVIFLKNGTINFFPDISVNFFSLLFIANFEHGLRERAFRRAFLPILLHKSRGFQKSYCDTSRRGTFVIKSIAFDVPVKEEKPKLA